MPFSAFRQRHHATKSAAAGFCYVNDIVLSILELQKNPTPERSFVFSSDPSSQANTEPLKRLKKILYIDLDLHHGDGVAEAFASNANVITVSIHLWSKGFYPSSRQYCFLILTFGMCLRLTEPINRLSCLISSKRTSRLYRFFISLSSSRYFIKCSNPQIRSIRCELQQTRGGMYQANL